MSVSASSVGQNGSGSAMSVPDLCSLLGQGWDCRGTRTTTGFILELFELPRTGLTMKRETCDSYLLLPAENTWRYQTRAVLYALGLLYCFIGLVTITARFMEAMENIVMQTREVVKRNPVTGLEEVRKETIWNSTVADITLLALGSSSPQISLAIIDCIQQLGETTAPGLGSGTLVGSAAFNLFVILAVCVVVPKNGSVRRIEKMGVLTVEVLWSVWAYLWLFIMLVVSSPNQITLAEAILTLLQFPLLISHAYAEDRCWSYVSFAFWCKKVATWLEPVGILQTKSRQVQSDTEGDTSDPNRSRYESIVNSPQTIRYDNPLHELAVIPSNEPHVSCPLWISQSTESMESESLPLDECSGDDLDPDPWRETKETLGLRDKWKAQLYHAMTAPSHADEHGKEVLPGLGVLLQHAITIFWRLLFALIPPADVWHGWPAFGSTLLFITGISALVIQLGNLLGCTTGISSYLIAVAVLASGTSLPDLVASKIAVGRGITADSGFANINASNCINIFVGIGLPYLIQVVYNKLKLKEGFFVENSGLSFSLIVYFITVALCWVALMLRRRFLGGELGGPPRWAIASSAFFFLLWFSFILFTALRVYDIL